MDGPWRRAPLVVLALVVAAGLYAQPARGTWFFPLAVVLYPADAAISAGEISG